MSNIATRDAVSHTAERPLSAHGGAGNALMVPPNAHFGARSTTSRRPLRSSPLAGPVVISLNDNNEEIAVVPRVSSSPTLPNETDLLVPAALHPRPRSSHSLSRPTSMISVYSNTSGSSSQEATSRRRSVIEPKGSWSSNSIPPSPPVQLEVPLIMTTRARQRPRSPNSQDPSLRYAFTSSPLSSSPNPVAGPSVSQPRRSISTVMEDETEANPSPTSSHSRPATSPRDNSWYVSNTYSETPKFSRLGLAGSGVVMPVSAKEHRKSLLRSPSGSDLTTPMDQPAGEHKSLRKRMSALSSTWSLRKLAAEEAQAEASIPPVPSLQPHSPSAVGSSVSKLSPLRPPPPIHSPSTSSSPSSSPKASFSDLGSTSSLPLTSPYSSRSIASSSRTSFGDETATLHSRPITPSNDISEPPSRQAREKIFSITPETLHKRRSVVSRMKSWRVPSSAPPVPPLPAEFATTAKVNSKSMDEPRKRVQDVSPPPPASVHDLRRTTREKHSSVAVQITHVSVERAAVVDGAGGGKDGSSKQNTSGLRKSGTIRRFFRVFVGSPT